MLLWALAAASVVFWAMRLATTAAPIPDGTRLAANGPLAAGDLSRLLGAPRVETGPAAAAPPPAANRFRLTGIVATSTRRGHDDSQKPGVALISVDGGPVRAYRVGEALDGQLSLWSVALRSARIGDRSGNGDAAFVLELPPPAAPATGTLAAAGAPTAPFMASPGYSPPPPGIGVPPPMMPPPNFQPAPMQQPFGAGPSGLQGSFQDAVPGIGANDVNSAMPSAAGKQGIPNSAVMRQ